MKRILFLNYEYPPLGGGAANANYYLLKEYSKNKDLVIDLVTSSIDKYKVETLGNNITIHQLNIGKKGNLHFQSYKDLITYSFKSYFYARKLMQRNKYDICHAFFGIPSGFIAMLLGLPYIVSLRGSDVPFYNQKHQILDKLLFKRLSQLIWNKSNILVANSKGMKEFAKGIMPQLNKDIEIITNGVDIYEFRPGNAKENNKTLEIVSTGRLATIKGYNYLLEAIKGMEGIRLTLVGDGPEKENLVAIAMKCKLNVDFMDKQPHKKIPSILAQKDLFILPSLNEGMSNSILEAMASGLPIITTNVGGSEELIKDNGFIVQPRDSDAIRSIILRLKDDRNLLKKMGKTSRKLAENLSWQEVAQSYRRLYDKLA